MKKLVLTPLAIARAEKRLSLSQVSVMVDYDRGGLSRIERGKARPRKELADKLCKIFELTRDQIMFPEDHMPPKLAKKPAGSVRLQEAQ